MSNLLRDLGLIIIGLGLGCCFTGAYVMDDDDVTFAGCIILLVAFVMATWDAAWGSGDGGART